MIQQQKTILSFDRLTVLYSNKVIFQHLSFQIKAGESWAILGESGAGKTALLKTIEGKLNITDGKVRRYYFDDFVRDNAIKDPLFTHQNLVAYIAAKHDFRNLSHTTTFYYQQRYNSFDSEDAQTVTQYLKEVQAKTKSYNVTPTWTVEEVIQVLHLTKLSERETIKLSNGETKRLMIAAALLKNPKLLLLDNPLMGLDVATRHQFNGILNMIKARGIIIIMATSPSEVPETITHIAVLREGKIIQSIKKEGYNPSFSFKREKPLNIETLKQLLSGEKQLFNLVVKMEKVSVSYGANKILNNINWEVKQGEHWALSGPNGSGKSTLLSLINGDNPQAYANNITLFDKKRGTGESIWDIKKKIGFVSPELHQYFPLGNTCIQVIESGFYDTQGLFRKSVPENKEKALKWMSFLNIETKADDLFKNVSSSTQRLCLLARALIKNPPLLILDEPCQGLDAEQQAYFRNMIDTICHLSSTTLIYVTHYEEELPDCIQHKMNLTLN